MKPDTLESPISPAAKETEAAEPQSHTATAAPAWTQEQLRAHVDYLMAKVHQSRETGTQDHREQAQGMRDRPQSLEDQRQGFWDERQGIEDRLRLLEAKSRSLQVSHRELGQTVQAGRSAVRALTQIRCRSQWRE